MSNAFGMTSCSKRQLSTVLLCCNFALSIGVVLINKFLFTVFYFHPVTLTAIHLLIVNLLLQICRLKRIYVVKRIDFIQYLPLSLLFCAYVLFNNLSIYCNNLVTYQLAKPFANLIVFAIEDLYRNKLWTYSLITSHVSYQFQKSFKYVAF